MLRIQHLGSFSFFFKGRGPGFRNCWLSLSIPVEAEWNPLAMTKGNSWLIFTYLTASWVSEMALISQPFLCVFRWEMSADPAALKALVVASRHQTSGHQDIQTCCFWTPEHRCWTRSHRECVLSAITSQWFNVEFSSILDIKVQPWFVKKGLFADIASCIRLFFKKAGLQGCPNKGSLALLWVGVATQIFKTDQFWSWFRQQRQIGISEWRKV